MTQTEYIKHMNNIRLAIHKANQGIAYLRLLPPEHAINISGLSELYRSALLSYIEISTKLNINKVLDYDEE